MNPGLESTASLRSQEASETVLEAHGLGVTKETRMDSQPNIPALLAPRLITDALITDY